MIFGAPFILMPGAAVAEDADAAAYLATQASVGPAPEPAWRAAVDALVKGMKADGTWSAHAALGLLSGPHELAGVVRPLIGPTLTNVNFVAGDYSRTLGLNGNGTNKYLDTNYSANALGQNNIAIWAYVTGSVPTGAGRFICANINHLSVLANASASGARARATLDALQTLGSGTTTPALVGVSRASSASFNWRAFGQGGSITQASTSGARARVFLFVGNSNATDGTAVSSWLPSGTQITAYGAGAAVDLPSIEARMDDYHAAIGAAL